MGDFELRGFGWRLLVVSERWKKKPDATAPERTEHHGGAFEANGSRWYDDKTVSLGFGRPTQ